MSWRLGKQAADVAHGFRECREAKLLRRVLLGWRRLSAMLSRRRALMLQKLGRVVTSRALAAWRALVQQRAATRHKALQVERRREGALLYAALCVQWRGEARRAQAERAATHSYLRQRGLHRWRAWVARRQARRVLEQAREQLCREWRRALAWDAWRERHVDRVTGRRADLHRTARAWATWRAVAEGRAGWGLRAERSAEGEWQRHGMRRVVAVLGHRVVLARAVRHIRAWAQGAPLLAKAVLALLPSGRMQLCFRLLAAYAASRRRGRQAKQRAHRLHEEAWASRAIGRLYHAAR